MLFSKNRITCSDPANDGKALIFIFRQFNAPGGTRDHFDRALACQGLQVFFRCVGTFEAKLPGYVGPGGRVACFFNVTFDEFEFYDKARKLITIMASQFKILGEYAQHIR